MKKSPKGLIWAFTGAAMPFWALGGCQAILGIPDEVARKDASAPGADVVVVPTPPDAAVDVAIPLSDSAIPDAPTVDADAGPPACDLTKDFDTPALVPSLSSPGHEGNARFFFDDELTVTFDAIRGDAGATDIYQATRATLTSPFGAPVKLDTVNTDDYEHCANLTDDGLTLFYENQVLGRNRVLTATRATKASPWDPPSPVANVNTSDYTGYPFVRGDGKEIYHVAVNGPDPTRIYVAKLVAGSGYVVSEIAEVNLDAVDGGAEPKQYAPVLSRNRLALYFATTKHVFSTTRRDTDIWIATRADVTDKFSLPREVPNVNGTRDEEPSWISADGCRLYLHSSRTGGTGGQDIYMASRKK